MMVRFSPTIRALPGVFLLAFAALSAAQEAGGERWKGTPQEQVFTSGSVSQYQCTTCHTIMERGGTGGPSLNQVANRRTEDWIRRWLKDPNSIKPGTKMRRSTSPPMSTRTSSGT